MPTECSVCDVHCTTDAAAAFPKDAQPGGQQKWKSASASVWLRPLVGLSRPSGNGNGNGGASGGQP